MKKAARSIDRKLLQQLIHLAGDRLKGRWVLLGGTLLPLLGIDYRVTTDIDLVGLGPGEQAQTLELMTLAEELGLPVESINQAAGFFLMKQKPFDHHLVRLYKGQSAEIFRPDLYLFLSLKIGRLSETDLQDCREMLKLEKTLSQEDFKKLKKRCETELRKSESTPKSERLRTLLQSLT